MSGVDFIEEIRIAQFWRKQLGEYEYVSYNPEDLRRWYIALETRGPQDIRDYLIERTGRYPMGQVTGIVAAAPHPPLNIIELWLDSYNKVRTGSYWLAGAAFLVFVYYAMTNLSGFEHLSPQTRLQLNPPPVGGPPSPGGNAPPPSTATLPQTLTPPASVASPPTGSSPSH